MATQTTKSREEAAGSEQSSSIPPLFLSLLVSSLVYSRQKGLHASISTTMSFPGMSKVTNRFSFLSGRTFTKSSGVLAGGGYDIGLRPTAARPCSVVYTNFGGRDFVNINLTKHAPLQHAFVFFVYVATSVTSNHQCHKGPPTTFCSLSPLAVYHSYSTFSS